MQIPRVLVLGATGRVGTVLRRCWPRAQVRWQSRRPRPDSACDWVVLDPVGQEGALETAARGCDAILNLAGVVPGQGGEMSDNAVLARAAVRAGAAVGARVLLASSAAVYGAQPGLLREDGPASPVSAYGHAKHEMERAGRDLAAGLGVQVTSLRIGNVAGLDAALGGWQPGFALDRFADGATPARSYVGPQHLARILWDLCAAPDLPPVLNVAAPGVVEMGALLEAAALPWRPRAAPDTAIARVEMSVALLARFTPLAPRDSLPDALVADWRAIMAGDHI